jgi:hypothetical protein
MDFPDTFWCKFAVRNFNKTRKSVYGIRGKVHISSYVNQVCLWISIAKNWNCLTAFDRGWPSNLKAICPVVLALLLGHQKTNLHIRKKNSMVLVRERTIPIERLPLVVEVVANFCG